MCIRDRLPPASQPDKNATAPQSLGPSSLQAAAPVNHALRHTARCV